MTTLQTLLVVLFFALFFYQAGAANLEGLMNYPFWRAMGPMMSSADFVKLRVDHLGKIGPLLVIPFGLSIVATVALVIVRPHFIPRWLLLVVLGLQLCIAASTALIQAPIQMQLNRTGFDLAAFDRLITTDLWFRKVPSRSRESSSR